jgi:hypothetical protein
MREQGIRDNTGVPLMPNSIPNLTPEVTARLRQLAIEVAAEGNGRAVLAREHCMAVVELSATGAVSIGSTGIMTTAGLAFLLWRDGKAYLAAKGNETQADAAQVESIRRFSADLKSTLA